MERVSAWRFIDPLPVLEYIDNDQDGDLLGDQADQESLESIIATGGHQGVDDA